MRMRIAFSMIISLAFAQCSDAGLIAVADAISSSVDSGSALATVDGSGLNDPVTDAHTGANIQQLVLNLSLIHI